MAEFYALLTGAAVLLCITLGIALKAMKIRLKNISLLKYAAVCMVLVGVDFIFISYTRLIEHPYAPPFTVLLLIFMMGMFFFGYLYFEALASAKILIKRFLPVWSLGILGEFILFSSIIPSIQKIEYGYLGFTICFTYGFIVMIIGISTMLKSYKIYKHDGLKYDIVAFSLAGIGSIVFSIMGALVWFDVYPMISLQRNILMFIGTIFFMCGICVLVLNSFKHRDYILFMPFPIHQIMIYKYGGICIYNRTVSVKTQGLRLKQDALMISGALTAFSDFFKELLGSKSQLRLIDATTSEFIFFKLPENAGTLIFLTSGGNYFLRRSMENFGNNLTSEYSEKIENSCSPEDVEEELDKLVNQYFPYLIIDRKSNEIDKIDGIDCN